MTRYPETDLKTGQARNQSERPQHTKGSQGSNVERGRLSPLQQSAHGAHQYNDKVENVPVRAQISTRRVEEAASHNLDNGLQCEDDQEHVLRYLLNTHTQNVRGHCERHCNKQASTHTHITVTQTRHAMFLFLDCLLLRGK